MELPEKITFISPTLKNKCFDAFQSMKNNGECCDVRINLENCTILAHRVILHAVFPGLKDVLVDKNTEGSEKEINNESIDSGIWETLIDFAYSGKLEITNDNVENLLLGAVYLNADEIINSCCDFLSKQINVGNAIKKLEFFENLHCTAMAETCFQFIRKHFEQVSFTEGFLQAPLLCIKELISSDDLGTSCEEKVFEAVMRWIKKCPSERKGDLPELLSLVRLTFIDREYLVNYVAADEDIRTSLVCRDLLDDAKNYHFLPKKRNLCSLVTRPRKKMRVEDEKKSDTQDDARLYVVSKRIVYNVQHLNGETGQWEIPESFELFCHTYTVTSCSNKIYFCDLDGLTYHDIASSRWEFTKKISNVRLGASSAILENKLYVCGGTDAQCCLNLVSCYDLRTKMVESVPPMDTGRLLPGVVALEHFLYVFGGLAANRTSLSSARKYNTISKTWIDLPPMFCGRYGMGCTEHNGKIYVCGGKSTFPQNILNFSEVYNPVKNCWKSIPPMRVARVNFSLVSCGRKLYAIGGSMGDQLLMSTEIYDPRTNVWELGPNIHPSQRYVQAFAAS